MMTIKRDSHTFISYPNRHHKFAKKLRDKLLKRKVSVWFDESRLYAGDPVAQELEKGLSSSRATIVIVDKEGLSPWQKFEVNCAIERKVNTESYKFIPILPPECGLDCLPPILKTFKAVKFESDDDVEAFEKLLEALRGRREKRDNRSKVVEEIKKERKGAEDEFAFINEMHNKGKIGNALAIGLMMKILERLNKRIEYLSNQLLSLKDDEGSGTPRDPKKGGSK